MLMTSGSIINREGLALNEDEVIYLESLSGSIGRKLTDSEVFGFLSGQFRTLPS